MTTIIIIFFAIVVIVLGVFLAKSFQLINGRKKTNQLINDTKVAPIPDLGVVKNLSILPLIDYYSDNDALKTEAGVSYLIKADDKTILMDVGFNQKKEHPSPLIKNMDTLGESLDNIDFIFFSHLHLDHVGGMAEQKNKEFSFSQGLIDIKAIPVYSPVPISPSKWNLGPKTDVVRQPKKLSNGIASIGPIPRYLFLMGKTEEQSLAINVENKGIVLIVGCGHQTIERIIERAKIIFKEPVYAIIGGLHFPVKNGRIMVGPLNLQNIFGSDRMPWNGIGDRDVESAIQAIKKESPEIIALSPHDSSDWSINAFKKAFKEKYQDIKVGQIIKF